MLLSRCRPWRTVLPRKKAGPMRCLFVLTSMPVGGAEMLLVNTIRRMNKDEFIPEVVCLKHPGPLGEQIANEFKVHSGLLRSKWDLRVLPRLVRLFHQRRADAVVTVGAGDKMFWGRLAAHLAGVPAIASALHSTGWPDGVGRLNRCLNGITDAYIAVAESHGDFLIEKENFPPEKVHVIQNGVDCSRFTPCETVRGELRDELGLSDNTPLIGIVAALRPEKNHAMLIRCAARIRQLHRDAHWLIVGDGPEREELQDLASSLQLDDRVHFLGNCNDTPRLLAALDVFTLCSFNEASPVSILEALACEVPVVASDVGSIGESVIDRKTGLLFPSEDIKAMTLAISELLSNVELRKSLGKAGRELVQDQRSLQTMVDGYQRLMQQLYDARVKLPARHLAARKSLTTVNSTQI